MGSGGPGNIVHIENLYVKPIAVKTNAKINLGNYCIFDTDGLRELTAADCGTGAIGQFLSLVDELAVYQAGETADNLTTTPVLDRKTKVNVILRTSDWVTIMEAGVRPNTRVGIQVKTLTPDTFVVNNTSTFDNIIGLYMHKEFAALAETSVLDDDGVIATGRI